MRVALIQVDTGRPESAEARVDRVVTMIRGCQDADLVCLPELWRVGYFNFDGYHDGAEDLDGPTVHALAAVARETGTMINTGSFIEARSDNKLRNTSVLLSPEGIKLSAYSKIHTFGYQSTETSLVEHGAELTVAAVKDGMLTTAVCYDLRFPGLWRAMVALGATAAVVPSAWPAARLSHWQVLSTARAIEGQMFVLACNGAGGTGGERLAGHSRVVDPSGVVLAEAGFDEEVVTCEIDLAGVAGIRAAFPVLQDDYGDYSVFTSVERSETAFSATHRSSM